MGSSTERREIRGLLDAFQAGYVARDSRELDRFMSLFTPDVEIIGTNGVRPGVEEWYVDRQQASGLVAGDWESWGDLRLELDEASIVACGDVGWVAAAATVTRRIGAEDYATFLQHVASFIARADVSPEEKVEYLVRGGANTIYELRRGETFVWPLRFTAVVVRSAFGQGAPAWRFAQLHFSFPTIYFPDVRSLE